MAIFKCKMCGGNLEVIEGSSVGICEYCGTKQTVPTAKDENLQGLYNRANTLRIKSEFDKAEQLYEKILQSDENQAEAYWGLILCKYGIEYVEDPTTFKRIPTCHRASYDSIIADNDYKSALKYADGSQRNIYEQEAKEIDRIQKEIIELSSKEEPYDVFICYKETDDTGSRTQDSVIANDIYYQLTQEGFKVFYAAITLEDKLGSAYEPCIFAALNSAKVMLAIGTKPEYFNAVWVKNEWSRYLKIMKKDRSKLLIPCYKNMDAYDLPDEFAHLQAQDMGKIGFINDVVRGIKKVVSRENSKFTSVVNVVNNTTTEPLLKRAFIFLEDGDWNSANEYCEKVLDIDPECAQAYLGKMMAALHIKKQEYLQNLNESFENDPNYIKTIRYADEKLCVFLKDCINKIKENENESKYNQAINLLNTSNEITEYDKAISIFKEIINFKDSKQKIIECESKLNELIEIDKQNRKEKERQREIERINAAKKQKKRKRLVMIISPVLSIIVATVIFLLTFNFNPWSDIVLVDAGFFHTVGLKEDGTVVAVGNKDYGQCDVNSWQNIIDLAAGYSHTIGLKSDGTVVATGYTGNKRCDVSKWEDIVKICAGRSNSIGLKQDGTVVATGDNQYGQCDVSKWKDIVAISSGDDHTVGLTADSKILATGDNRYGQCDVSDWKDIVAISAGGMHTVGLNSNGKVFAVGDNESGQCDVSDWSDIVAIATGYKFTVGLKSDGSVVATGYNEYGQCDMANWKEISKIAAFGNHTVGIKVDGTVIAVGRNDDGQCNVGRLKRWW